MKMSRASPGFIMIASLVLLALSVAATVSSTDASVSSRIIYVEQEDPSSDFSEGLSAEKIQKTMVANNPTDEVEVLDVGKVVNGATAIKIWFVPMGPTSSSPAPASILASNSTGMTGTSVDPWEVSRGVGEMM